MRTILSVIALLALAACGSPSTPDNSATQEGATQDASARLAALLDEHFERNLAFTPVTATSIGDSRYDDQYANSIGPDYRAAVHDLNVEFLERLQELDRSALDQQEQDSYDMFELQRKMALAGEQFPTHLVPMNQFRSATSSFVTLGSGSGLHPFETVQNYDDFLGRIDGFVVCYEDGRLHFRKSTG